MEKTFKSSLAKWTVKFLALSTETQVKPVISELSKKCCFKSGCRICELPHYELVIFCECLHRLRNFALNEDVNCGLSAEEKQQQQEEEEGRKNKENSGGEAVSEEEEEETK